MKRIKIFLNSAICLLVVVGFSSQCATMRAYGAKTKYINEQTQNYVYNKPIKKVWGSVHTMLFTRGFTTREPRGTSAYFMSTDWKYTKNSSGVNQKKERYMVEGKKEGANKCRIVITYSYANYKRGTPATRAHWDSPSTSRSLSTEYKLIKIVEPDNAAKIEAEGNRIYEETKKGKK